MYILGAGLAGCLAAISNPKAIILEGNAKPTVSHKALLRMRTKAVSHLTGIPFKKVTVDKFIYDDDRGYQLTPTPFDIINYSRKVNSFISRRSITNMDPEVRYIPPPDFHYKLLKMLDGRIKYDSDITSINEITISGSKTIYDREGVGVISTIPLPVMLKATNMGGDLDFTTESSDPIYVSRFLIDNCDLYMTIYYTSPDTDVYRATISGDLLTVESMMPIDFDAINCEIDMVYRSFGDLEIIATLDQNFKQTLGKIRPIDDDDRRNLLFQLTRKFEIYSLGRFACWRQILLDDVVHDIAQITKMINTHPYDRNKA